MKYKHARYNTISNKITNEDKLFAGNYTIDPYQNCEFGCTYCDSTIDNTIFVKTNAVQLLKKEILTMEKGTIIIGSVVDPYQMAEKKYGITRELLKTVKQENFPVHILSKSTLIERDIDLLSNMNDCLVTVSITTLDEDISRVFEKKAPLPHRRLQVVKKLAENGIKTGLAVIPILPFIVEKELEEIMKQTNEHKASYVLHKHLELKGDQKNIFIATLKKHYPGLVEKYEKLYEGSYMPDDSYISKINQIMTRLCAKYSIKNKI